MPKTLSTRNTVRDIGASHKKVEDGTLESPEEFVRKLLGRTTFFPRVHALKQQTPPSTRRRRLLVGGNSHEVAIERNSPIDCGRFISGDEPVSALCRAHHAVV